MVVAANLVVCGVLVAVFMVVRKENAPSAAVSTQVGETARQDEVATGWSPPPSSDYPTTTVPPGPGAGFVEVVGPGGMTTHIPDGWPVRTASGPGAMQADDPTGASRVLRYGGSATDVTDSYEVHAAYESEFSANKANYVSIRLERTVVRGMSAIDWEFEYDAAEGRRHVRSMYWLSGGYEYFVYASAPVAGWPGTQPILDVMLAYSTP
jgi:hypothetical protein